MKQNENEFKRYQFKGRLVEVRDVSQNDIDLELPCIIDKNLGKIKPKLGDKVVRFVGDNECELLVTAEEFGDITYSFNKK